MNPAELVARAATSYYDRPCDRGSDEECIARLVDWVRQKANTVPELYFGQGRCGYAYALLAAGSVYERRDAAEAGIEVAREVLSEFSSGRSPTPLGLFSGVSGIGLMSVALLEVGGSSIAPSALSALRRCTELVESALAEDQWLLGAEVLSGLSGLLLFLAGARGHVDTRAAEALALQHLLRSAKRDTKGTSWCEPLDQSDRDSKHFDFGSVNLGVAHGIAGVMLALSATLTSECAPSIRELLSGAVAFLLASEFPQELRDASSLFPVAIGRHAPGPPARLAWCYSDLSVALALAAARDTLGERSAIDDITRIIRAVRQRENSQQGVFDACACHGYPSSCLFGWGLVQRGFGDEVQALFDRYRRMTIQFVNDHLEGPGLPVLGWGRKIEYPQDMLRGPAGTLLALAIADAPASSTWGLPFGIAPCVLPEAPRSVVPVRTQSLSGALRFSCFSEDGEENVAAVHGGQGEDLSGERIQTAIRLASPTLLDSPDSDAKTGALRRYLRRACFRPTPFGLFAGVAALAKESSRDATNSEINLRYFRDVDSEFLAAWGAEAWNEALDAGAEVSVMLNPTLWFRGGSLRWMRTRGKASASEWVTYEVEIPVALRDFLAELPAGVHSASTLCGLIGVPAVQGLLNDEILVAVTPLQLTYDEAERPPELPKPLADPLHRGLHVQVAEFLDASAEVAPCSAELEQLLARATASPGYRAGTDIVQVDVVASSPVHIPAPLHTLLRETHDIVWRSGVRRRARDLSRFADRFRDRYGDLAVPLAEAVDPDCGLGFPVSLLSADVETDLDLSGLPPVPGGNEWKLSAEELRAFVDASKLRCDELEHGRHVLLARVGKAPGGPWYSVPEGIYPVDEAAFLGRFSRAAGGVSAALKRIVEETPPDDNAVPAEIICLSEPRAANVLRRMRTTEYEIWLWGRGAAEQSKVVLLRDLLVSHDGWRLRIWSERHGLELSPRLSAAHLSPRIATPAYLFLAAFAAGRVGASASWNWMRMLPLRLLPRVVTGTIVLSPRMVRLEAGDLSRPDWAERLVSDLSTNYVIEDAYEDGEGAPWNLSVGTDRSELARLLRRKRKMVLAEHLPHPNDHWVILDGRRVASEFALGFSQLATQSPPLIVNRSAPLFQEPRTAEWAYWRAYGGGSELDDLLPEAAALFQGLKSAGQIGPWFFVRYLDPLPHLRFRAEAGRDAATYLATYLRGLVARRTRRGELVSDVYRPELARYGGADGMTLAESVFHASSIATAQPEVLSRRGRERLLACAALLEQFLLAICECDAVVGEVLRRALEEYCASDVKKVRKAIGLESRTEAWEGSALPQLHGFIGYEEILRSAWGGFAALERERQLVRPAAEILRAMMHMHVNRVLEWGGRDSEAHVYELVRRRAIRRAWEHRR